MIGNIIIGIENNNGQEISGLVLDKVRTLVTLQVKQPGVMGPGQAIPFALDCYLVYNEDKDKLYLVQPAHVKSFITAGGQ